MRNKYYFVAVNAVDSEWLSKYRHVGVAKSLAWPSRFSGADWFFNVPPGREMGYIVINIDEDDRIVLTLRGVEFRRVKGSELALSTKEKLWKQRTIS